MLGLGETTEELLETLADLRAIGCDFLTLGQYLQPSPRHLPVERYLPPEEFDELGRLARALGFAEVASGPMVRSSYHADEMARSARIVRGHPKGMLWAARYSPLPAGSEGCARRPKGPACRPVGVPIQILDDRIRET